MRRKRLNMRRTNLFTISKGEKLLLPPDSPQQELAKTGNGIFSTRHRPGSGYNYCYHQIALNKKLRLTAFRGPPAFECQHLNVFHRRAARAGHVLNGNTWTFMTASQKSAWGSGTRTSPPSVPSWELRPLSSNPGACRLEVAARAFTCDSRVFIPTRNIIEHEEFL